MSRRKTYRVRFSETNFYTIDLKAMDEEDAIERATERYIERAYNAPRGFTLDISEGVIDNEQAILLAKPRGGQR